MGSYLPNPYYVAASGAPHGVDQTVEVEVEKP
jgi:hypothetical protein